MTSKRKKMIFTIDLIGEDVKRDKLSSLYNELEKSHDNYDSIDEEIDSLEREIRFAMNALKEDILAVAKKHNATFKVLDFGYGLTDDDVE